jgi:hypothetical protein
LSRPTWNSAGVVQIFLDHYRQLGFDQVLLMDFEMTDGTLEVLKDKEYRDFVKVV